ncbi:MAG: ABC transporter permease, partial [Eisenbergiella sp.]
MIYIVLILMIVAISILSQGNFLGFSNVMNVFRQVTITGTLAIGMTLVLITGGIDLSVGAVMALAGVVGSDMAHTDSGVPLIVPILIGLAIGLVFGIATGSLIAYLDAPAFIVTLGMTSIARGIAYI